ncbi:BICD family-like cargo adapter 1 isoform X2 [Dermacentor albipictus]|uniref:BICD family-like cargo adapter 1 isoform X2 n=1 Tax=Dermacentor albipictus TaxID=60249 RepID=UPI0031FC7391
MDDDLYARVRQLEADLKQAAEIGKALLTKNGHLEEELEHTHKRYVATVEKLEQELHSTRMKLECSMETEKCLSADLEHARDQLAKSKKESLTCQVALKKLQAALDENDRTLSDQAFMAEKEKLQKQVRRLEEQLCESRQMNERLLSHNTSSTASSPDALDSSQAACEQEMQLVLGQLHDEIAELKAEKEAALQHLGEAKERLKATLNDLSAQKALFQKQEDECGELRAQLESLQMDQEKERFLREEVRRTRNQMALILATGSVNKADARQLRLLQESLTCANAEISRLTGALARQTNEQASLDNTLLDGNPLAGLLKMERQRVKELEKERAALLKSISERQLREDRLLRETYEAAQKAEASEARLLKAMVRKSEEQPLSAGFEPRKEVYENLGMVEDKPPVLREVIPMRQKAETVATLGSKSTDSSAGCGGTESKSCGGARPKVTFEEHSAKENKPDAEPDGKKFKRRGTVLKPLLEVKNTGKVVTEAPECKQQ